MGLEQERAFGWAYFHFISPPDTVVVWICHLGDIYGRDNHPYQSLRLWHGGRSVVDVRDSLTAIELGNSRSGAAIAGVSYGDSRVTWDTYVRDVHFRGELSLLRDGLEFELGSARETHHMWSVRAPMMSFTAMLETPDAHFDLAGTGYHDVQFGRDPLHKIVRHWIWFAAGDTHESIVGLVARRPETRYGLARLPIQVAITQAGDTHRVGSISPDLVTQLDDRGGEVRGHCTDLGLSFELAPRPTDLIRSRQDRIGKWIVSYRRWLARTRLVGEGEWSGIGLLEEFNVRG